MAELVKLDERLISGKGVLKVPAGAFQDRYYILYLDVIRRPKNEYLSFEWNPPRSVYARLVFRKDGYVQSEDIMRYQREERTYVNDITGQNLRAIKCAYEGILISFDRQNAALGLIPLPYDNLILDYKSLSLGWDEILFQCYADTAIQCRFYSLDYDTCNPANDQTDLPPPPPPPLPPVTPGTPIGSISNPYDPDTEDDGNTQPFPGDASEPPPVEPPGEACVKYRVTIEYEQAYGDPLTTKEIICYGEVGDPFIVPSGGANAVVLPCRGYAFPTLDDGCQPSTVNRTVFVSDSVRADATPEIVGFEEYIP